MVGWPAPRSDSPICREKARPVLWYPHGCGGVNQAVCSYGAAHIVRRARREIYSVTRWAGSRCSPLNRNAFHKDFRMHRSSAFE